MFKIRSCFKYGWKVPVLSYSSATSRKLTYTTYFVLLWRKMLFHIFLYGFCSEMLRGHVNKSISVGFRSAVLYGSNCGLVLWLLGQVFLVGAAPSTPEIHEFHEIVPVVLLGPPD